MRTLPASAPLGPSPVRAALPPARLEASVGSKVRASAGGDRPSLSPRWVSWFTRYSRWYLRRHFHSLRCCVGDYPELPSHVPWVVYVNHASWWDPLVGLVLKDALFPHRQLYAPMEQAAVERYAIFKRMGFFGVERRTTRGAIRFLRTAEEILASPTAALSITPQGRFADCRERPLRFDPGLGAVASRSPGAVFLPVAIEYVFWEERLPEILVRLGRPDWVVRGQDENGSVRSVAEWTSFFEARMAATQDALAAAASRRDPDDFRCLLRGGAGQGGVYDLWRAMKSWLRGERFRKEHGVR